MISKSHRINFNNKLHKMIKKVNEIKNLGVFFDIILTFVVLIIYATNRAMKTLGLLMRSLNNFSLFTLRTYADLLLDQY